MRVCVEPFVTACSMHNGSAMFWAMFWGMHARHTVPFRPIPYCTAPALQGHWTAGPLHCHKLGSVPGIFVPTLSWCLLGRLGKVVGAVVGASFFTDTSRQISALEAATGMSRFKALLGAGDDAMDVPGRCACLQLLNQLGWKRGLCSMAWHGMAVTSSRGNNNGMRESPRQGDHVGALIACAASLCTRACLHSAASDSTPSQTPDNCCACRKRSGCHEQRHKPSAGARGVQC